MSITSTNVPHILKLTTEAKKDFLDSFDLVFFDCDGVIWLVSGFIPHTEEAITLFKEAGKICKFVSNNSIRKESEYVGKFRTIGLNDVEEDDIIHSAKSMIKYIKANYPPNVRIFSICSEAANELMIKNGLNIETLDIVEHLSGAQFVQKIRIPEEKVSVVLFDANLNLNFAQLTRANQYFEHNDECTLLVGAMDMIIPMATDININGFGYFLPLLIGKSKKEPIFLGKPGSDLRKLLKETLNITKPKRCLFVGDALKEDIGFGKACGFQTLLVLTGATTKESMLKCPDEHRPDFYADSLTDFVEFFKDLKKEN